MTKEYAMKVDVGSMYYWHPTMMRGRDGKTYPVFTFVGSGSGWQHKMYFTPADESDHPLLVCVQEQERYLEVKDTHQVLLCPPSSYRLMLKFSKLPYIRMDGKFQVISGDPKPVNELYPCLGKTTTIVTKDDHMIFTPKKDC